MGNKYISLLCERRIHCMTFCKVVDVHAQPAGFFFLDNIVLTILCTYNVN